MDFIKLAWKEWKRIAKIIARFQARIILTIFYFTLLAPLGIIFSTKKDELKIHTKQNTVWKEKKKQSQTVEDMRRQF